MDTPAMHPKARCEALIVALRAEMPPRFTWDFRYVKREENCGTAGCALGLAWTLGIVRMPLLFSDDHKLWGMDEEEYDDTFYSSIRYDDLSMAQVTPAMVADRLERLLAEGCAGKELHDCEEM